MKKILSVIFFLIPFLIFSQGIRNTGGTIKITAGAYVYVNAGGYLNESNGANHGTIDSEGSITLTGNWTNNATDVANKVFTNLNATGTVNFIGATTPQIINGTNPTNFENLVINKTLNTQLVQLANSEINGSVTVGNGTQGILTLTNGGLQLNSRTIVINNTSAAALTYVLGNSYIISETYDGGSAFGVMLPQNPCNSKIKWNIGTATGNYIFPFFTVPIRNVSLIYNNVGGAGVGAGSVTVSTYHTNNLNYPYATDGTYPVLHMAGYFIPDNSANAVDRFHILNVSGYATKPTASIVIYYDDFNDLNGIPEANLQAQRWTWIDATHGYWSNLPVGAVNAVNNYVSAIPTDNSVQCNIWVLSNNTNPLPIELISFDGRCLTDKNELYWSTATETNNDYFTVERSENLKNWEEVTIVKGAGNSNSVLNYTTYDYHPKNNLYYRLKQTDFNGKSTYSKEISLKCNEFNNFEISIFQQNKDLIFNLNNPNNLSYTISLFDILGRKMITNKYELNEGFNQLKIDISNLIIGCYTIVLQSDNEIISKKIIIK